MYDEIDYDYDDEATTPLLIQSNVDDFNARTPWYRALTDIRTLPEIPEPNYES